MAVFLLAPSSRRLIDVFVLNRATVAPDLSAPLFHRRWQRVAALALWVFMVGSQLAIGVVVIYQQYHAAPVRSPLYGLYQVVSGAPEGWQKVVFDGPDFIVVRMTDGTLKGFSADYDLAKSTLTVNKKTGLASLNWSRPETGKLVLTGTFEGAPVTFNLRRIDGEFMLNRRGFHWISEVPFNR